MSVSGSIHATIQIRGSLLVGLIGVVAALAASVTWVMTAVAFDTGTSGSLSSSYATSTPVAAAQHGRATFTMSRKQIEGLSTMSPPQTRLQGDPLRWRLLRSSPVSG